ncbi:hypothetical protein CSA56_00915 [candidate division KSB3 bacterium]|uniref:4Fe-4S ferredoxin-type domain-containing protein n=1 Tax=candidate division KSB3 bacterium TaxID=2044937 RepID=A0A2G6KMZ9_9BACT|nr:MAG: hypothetical protein CSA56_00915 [candidate division KSB3 bacterium]
MTVFQPIPFKDLIKRVFSEYKHHSKIFGLPEENFFMGTSGESIHVSYMGKHAATPFGPAAGPHTQLAQNLLLAWLTGARILELKTVQSHENLALPRPSIDTETIGFNVTGSQELSLDASLREYVKAWILIQMIVRTELFGEEFSRLHGATVFDLSIGYDFKGIKSQRITDYIRNLQDATTIIEELCEDIPKEYAELKTLDYDPHIIESVTLSTFRGCTADEIDHIVSHLLTELRLNVIVKLNPTLLGADEVVYVLHDVLGYTDIKLDRSAFQQDIQFNDAVKIIQSMFHTASSFGKTLGLKFTNTLAVHNHKAYFSDDLMYMSGHPLHVLSMRLLREVKEALGNIQSRIPMSFSAGVDEKNFADMVSLNLYPVTVCTDMLKYPGYTKAQTYLQNLAEEMQQVEAINIPDFIMKRFGHELEAIHGVFSKLRDEVHVLGQQLPDTTRNATIQSQLDIFMNLQQRVITALKENSDSLELLTTDALIITETLKAYNLKFGQSFLVPHTFKELYQAILSAAADRNLETLVESTIRDPRYTYAKNKKTPKKLSEQLGLHNCMSCCRCVAICPNNANFVYHVPPMELTYTNFRIVGNNFEEVEGGEFVLKKFLQIANFADCCNECGLCAIHCMEEGKPYTAKPKYFGSLEYWEECDTTDGFFVEVDGEQEFIAGRIGWQEYRLWYEKKTNVFTFADGVVEAIFSHPEILKDVRPLIPSIEGHIIDMKFYYILFTQLKGVLNDENCNYINIKYL